jgi:LytS/YehU family sensor histidine kinase
MKLLFPNSKAIFGFDDKWLIIIGVPVVSFLIPLIMFGDVLMREPKTFFQICTSVSLAYTVIYWIAFRFALLYFWKRFNSPKEEKKRLIYQSVAVIAGYFALKVVLDPILHKKMHEIHGDLLRTEIGMTIGSLVVTFLVLGIYEIFGYYNKLQKTLLEKERLVKENVQGQLESLKNQVNPHFFFNSLNTLSYLIPEAPEKAVAFVQRLSKAYRYILEIREKVLVTLAEELSFLESYNCLLTERFGDNLRIRIQTPDEYQHHKIVPLSLQMLFENAIKHNVVSVQKPLTIEVFVENGDRLVVKNNLQRKNQETDSTKVGLSNIRSRYQMVSDREVEVIVTPVAFTVILPLLKPRQEVEWDG